MRQHGEWALLSDGRILQRRSRTTAMSRPPVQSLVWSARRDPVSRAEERRQLASTVHTTVIDSDWQARGAKDAISRRPRLTRRVKARSVVFASSALE